MAKLKIKVESVQEQFLYIDVADDVAEQAAENTRYSDPSALLGTIEGTGWSAPTYRTVEVLVTEKERTP